MIIIIFVQIFLLLKNLPEWTVHDKFCEKKKNLPMYAPFTLVSFV